MTFLSLRRMLAILIYFKPDKNSSLPPTKVFCCLSTVKTVLCNLFVARSHLANCHIFFCNITWTAVTQVRTALRIISYQLQLRGSAFHTLFLQGQSIDLHLIGNFWSSPKQLEKHLVKNRLYCRWMVTQFWPYVEKYPMLIIFITKVVIGVLFKVVTIYLNSD